MVSNPTAIVWFRQDLRLFDNIALNHAITEGFDIIPVYILDDDNSDDWKMGGASRWWLHHSLDALNKSLDGNLLFRVGAADKIIPQLLGETGATAVFWNRCYEPWRIERDKKIKADLTKNKITIETFKDFLLWEPWEIHKDDGTPYKVFTPYYRRGCLSKAAPAHPKKSKPPSFAKFSKRGKLDDLKLMPKIQWFKTMEKTWQPGEDGARKIFKKFLKDGLKGYNGGRNYPERENVSRLSPYLHFGEISIREIWHTAIEAGVTQQLEKDADTFCSELGWREFSNSLLYYNPQLPTAPLQPAFKKFKWDKDDKALLRWQRGETGIPLVDAGMRELWQTGYMHNRVRMVVASFLVKNLRLHWHEGEKWFWDCLVDADLANNSASWQWVAGCGADAAPYYRVFNPVTQSEKFDPDGDYIRKYVPELAHLDNDDIHKPWSVGVKKYPEPLVDLAKSRVEALEAYKAMKN